MSLIVDFAVLTKVTNEGEAVAQLKPRKWKDGRSERDGPRKLYGRDSVVLLVSRVYVCPQGHEIPAHDPRILNSLPNDKNIPFILSHKSGVTIGFMNQVNSLASSGSNISNTRKSVSSGYPNPEKWVEKTRRSRVFLTDFEVFGYMMKHSFEFLIWLLKPFIILREIQSKSLQNFMLIKIRYPNHRHGSDFLCFLFMHY